MFSPIDRSPTPAGRCLQLAGYLLGPLYVLMVAALYGAFLYAPTAQIEAGGEVQRIFYFHVGAAWNAFLAFFVVFIAALAFLIGGRRIWDHIGVASVEVGVIFTTIVLTTGPIWAKPVWNTWWPWGDPRVMTTLVLWLIYIAYLILRASLPEGEKKYKYCAVFGIIGFLDVPIVWLSIRWWRTIHPVVITSGGAALETEMVHALIVSTITFTVLYATLLLLRLAMRLNASGLEEAVQQVTERNFERA